LFSEPHSRIMEFRYSFALFWLLWHSIAAIQVNFDDPGELPRHRTAN